MNTGLGENIWLPAGVKLWVASRQNARQTLRCLRCLFVACVRNAGGARAAGLMPPPPRPPPCGPPAQRARSDAAAFVWHNTYSLGIQLESEKTLEGREVNEPHVKKTRSKTPTR